MVADISDWATRDQKVTELPTCRSPIRAHLSRYRLIYPGTIGKIETRKLFNDQLDLVHVPRPWPVAIHFLQRNDIRIMHGFYNAIEIYFAVKPTTKLDVIGNYFDDRIPLPFIRVLQLFYTHFTPGKSVCLKTLLLTLLAPDESNLLRAEDLVGRLG